MLLYDKNTPKELIQVSMQTLSHLESTNFQIPTYSILELMEQLEQWIISGVCGAMICGRSRIGKSSAIEYASRKLQEVFGENFPVFRWSLNEHLSNARDKAFYAELLNALDIDVLNYQRLTALELKTKAVNYIAIKAAENPLRKAVLFLDEAYKLGYKEYYWLMDLYNVLNSKYHVILSVFMFGTPREMQSVKDAFEAKKQTQIVERFMINEFAFRGLRSPDEMALCLKSLDDTTVQSTISGYSNITLAELFFPMAFKEGKARFFDLTSDYWEAFAKIKGTVTKTEIPMHYFMQSFILGLSRYGIVSEKHYFLTRKDIEDAVEGTGYGKTDD